MSDLQFLDGFLQVILFRQRVPQFLVDHRVCLGHSLMFRCIHVNSFIKVTGMTPKQQVETHQAFPLK